MLTSVFSDLRLRLRRIATGILGDSDDADDALQDAFCRLWQHHKHIKSRQEAEALSVTTVHNICIDNIRRQSHSPTVSIDENRDSTDAIDTADNEEYTSREDLFRNIEQIVNNQLSERQQTILRMREIEGMSFEAIAESLEMQPTAVRMALSRTRKLIREIYLKTRSDE